jgi:hypothetical protein
LLLLLLLLGRMVKLINMLLLGLGFGWARHCALLAAFAALTGAAAGAGGCGGCCCHLLP